MHTDPQELPVNWGGVANAGAGIVGNGFGLVGGVALTSATGGLAVGVGAVIAVKSGYGLGVSVLNLIDAIADREPSSKGALFNDLADKVAPCNEDAQRAASALELATDLIGGRVAGAATNLSRADKYGNVLLEGGTKIGPMWSDASDHALGILGATQAAQTGYQAWEP
jgi:hypothetical protein